MKRFIPTILPYLSIFIFTGCYTQFVKMDQPPSPSAGQVEWVVDSTTGDTVKVIKQVDTINAENNQTCVWERDLMGYPQLRCYDSFYPRDWFVYNNSPWWYRNDPYWYDYNHCPRYYYYDQFTGRCIYTGTTYHRQERPNRSYQNSSSEPKPEQSTPGGSSMYPRVRGVPDPRGTKPVSSTPYTNGSSEAKTSSAESSSRESGQIIVTPDSREQPRIVNQRGVGVPSSQTSKPLVTTPVAIPKESTTAKVAPPNASPAAASTPPSSGSETSTTTDQPAPSQKSRRRNPRSW